MLSIKNLTIKTDLNRVLVQELSFVANDGDRIAIIGEEGNGKSTLLKVLADDSSSRIRSLHVSKEIFPEGQVFGYLQQSFPQEYLTMMLHDYLSEANDDEREIARLFSRMMNHLDHSDLYRPLVSFSGGERVRAQIIRLMLGYPDIYLLDEPTNDLDIGTMEWLAAWMKDQTQPMLFVSHDITFLNECSTKIIHLEQRKRKQQAVSTYCPVSYKEYAADREAMIAKNNQKAFHEQAEFNQRLERWTKLYQKVDHQQNTISRQDAHGGQLLKKHMKHLQSQKKMLDKKELTQKIETEEGMDLFFDSEKERRKGVMLAADINPLMIGNTQLAKHVQFNIHYGEKLGCIGRNGAGKTTLSDHLIALSKAKGLKVASMPQDYFKTVNSEQSALEFVCPDMEKSKRERVREMLGSLKFTADEMMYPLKNCSLGQVAKIYLLSLVMSDADLIFLDEPTRNLSPLSMDSILTLFSGYHKTLWVVSHDRYFLKHICDRILLLDEQGIHESDILTTGEPI